jgi:dethiobiotin synthetase
MTRIVIVTGTDTGVGKTIATAALAVRLGRPLVIKPTQTGIAPDGSGDERDIDVVARLSDSPTLEFTTLEDPLAPDTAARLRSVTIPPVREYAERIRHLATGHDTIVVEGAGGLLVRLDTDGGTLLDLAADLSKATHDRALRRDPRRPRHAQPHRAHRPHAARSRAHAGRADHRQLAGLPQSDRELNRTELARVTGVPVVAVIPEGAGTMTPEAFQRVSPHLVHPLERRYSGTHGFPFMEIGTRLCRSIEKQEQRVRRGRRPRRQQPASQPRR